MMNPVRRPIRLLNHAIYRAPDAEHTYVVGVGVHGKDFHVPVCPKLKGQTGTEKVTGVYNDLFTSRITPCGHCHPHGRHKVTLPDGTDRYRPMGPIATGQHGDRRDEYGEYALCEQHNGVWRVREWAADAPAAVGRAAQLGITTILGPRSVEHGLPTVSA
ncbi:hypothetical protein AB0K21_21555 [Streptosporangium sp. NPDC049248]|uniref:hypothetical protein n=1 Tax=Streptosporangium sp. NPDC049248 TaxID=3155651 RepID=UPI00342D698C